MTKDEFIKLVNDHDLTYTYSDDGDVFRRGVDELYAIKAASHNFDRAFVIETWNAAVDKKLRPGFRDGFYWKA